MPGLKPVSGETVIKILSKQYGFVVSGQSGSHVRLSKATPGGRISLTNPRGSRRGQSMYAFFGGDIS